MRVTKRTSTAMAWLLDFLNFDARSSDGDRYGSIESVMALQRKWSQHLCFIVEPKPLADALIDSLEVGISYNESLKSFNEKEIRTLTDKARSKGMDPEADRNIKARKREITGFQKHVDDMVCLLETAKKGKKDIAIHAENILKELDGAEFLTPLEALEKLVEELNLWSLGKSVNPIWKLRRIAAPGTQTEPGQGVVRIGRAKFAVDKQLSRRELEDEVYSNVAKCLETGEFDRLRRCQLKECRHFFFAQHFRQTHCCPQHQKERDNKQNAAERVKKSRAKGKRQLRSYALTLLDKPRPAFFAIKKAFGKMDSKDEFVTEAFRKMLAEIEIGVPKEKIWAKASPRQMSVFKKIKSAGIT